MPAFLEKKLKARYGKNKHAIYGTMNKIGAMKGNKITPKGKRMEKKHAKDMAAKKKGRREGRVPCFHERSGIWRQKG